MLEAQPENSPDAVQKFFASMAHEPAKKAPPQAAAGAQPASQAQPAPAQQGNGAAIQPFAATESAAPAAQAPRPPRTNPVSTAFGDTAALLAKSPAHKHFSLADLEWLLLPPLVLNQFALADAKLSNGQTVLAGFALWARVAPGVDARLAQSQHDPVRLRPNEWQSGDIFWIIDGVGNPEVVRNIITDLARTPFRRKRFKIVQISQNIKNEDSIQRKLSTFFGGIAS